MSSFGRGLRVGREGSDKSLYGSWGPDSGSLTWLPSSWTVPPSLLKGAIFSLTFLLQEEECFFVHISCVLCGKVAGNISSPSEAYEEYLIRCLSTP